MKLTRTVSTIALAASATTSLAAFTAAHGSRRGGAFLGKSLQPSTGKLASSVIRSSGPTMLLNNLFGGAFAPQRIDYSTLDHPGPELGQMAEQGIVPVSSIKDPNLRAATFAGGCFWGLELAYQRVPGVVYTATGYTQGGETFPTYNQVCSGATGHTEAIFVYYDPAECSYEQLLDTFFARVNPTTVNGQGNDFGRQYRTGIYFHTPEQEAAVKARMEQVAKQYNKPLATEVKAAQPFWPAEKYHQQYLEKGGRFGMPQNASKGATDTIRCYG